MSRDQANFVDLCLAGRAFPDEIDDYIDRWHDGKTGRPLHEFLGMTHVEYSLWVERPEYLKLIISSRKRGESIENPSALLPQLRMAARADSQQDAEEMIEWLKRTGRIEG